MRAVVVTAAIAATLAGWAIGPPAQSRQRDDDWRQTQCRYQSLQPGTWTELEERRTAGCVVQRWPVPGGLSKFSAVVACESGWNRLANNAGNYLGLAQHSARYWPDRVTSLMPERWRIGPWDRWQNSRSQIVVTARMAHSAGWLAWTCS
jgi:hypothetical protein